MNQGRQAEAPRMQDCRDCLEHDEAEEPGQLVTLVQCVPEAATDALEPPRERLPPRQLHRWSTALVVDRVHQGAVLRAHVHRPHHTATMLQASLRAQQEPCGERVQSFECSAVNLDVGGAFGIQTAQYGIKTASLADD